MYYHFGILNMKCIKTGAVVYVESTHSHYRIDLFYDGMNLYMNNNVEVKGKPPVYDVVCASIMFKDFSDKHPLVLPLVSKKLIEYVDGPWSGQYEQMFIENFKYDTF